MLSERSLYPRVYIRTKLDKQPIYDAKERMKERPQRLATNLNEMGAPDHGTRFHSKMQGIGQEGTSSEDAKEELLLAHSSCSGWTVSWEFLENPQLWHRRLSDGLVHKSGSRIKQALRSK
jgi:hypothetical protein